LFEEEKKHYFNGGSGEIFTQVQRETTSQLGCYTVKLLPKKKPQRKRKRKNSVVSLSKPKTVTATITTTGTTTDPVTKTQVNAQLILNGALSNKSFKI